MSESQTDFVAELPDRYEPSAVEAETYRFWESGGYFRAQDQSKKPPFSIILPPPNVTGSLHMGHALDQAIQDLYVRWKRMSGFNALWLPGIDHAGIATQAVVERDLKKEGQTRKALGREAFLERVWAWKHQHGDRIFQQMRRLGDSCDWERTVFTLDEGVSKAVRKVFVDLYRRQLIYRGTRLVNWSPPLETAISDLEVEHKETKGVLYHIAYPLADAPEFQVVVATTRPETLLGDTAVAVHGEDARYQPMIGKMLRLPLTDRLIPLIADEAVDPSFGTGAVKITPAHDFNDFKVGTKHGLGFINLLHRNGSLNENAGIYSGLKVSDARTKIVEALREKGLLIKEEAIKHSVGYCSRTGAVVEPFLSEQWFVRMRELAAPARHVVESGSLKFEPESWTKVYLHWLSIIEDWCISRQLWWGHRIPAWKCTSCNHLTVSETDPTHCEGCGSSQLERDDDVLDTWFSSALWAFSPMGWPNETEAQKTFYPTDLLVTGHDIIFFWVTRMIIMGLEFKKDIPFRKVYIHGLLRDSQGRKMSKSLGNGLDPIELIDRYGADALRFSILSQIASGRDLRFSEQRLEGYRNFMNKIWNATRFSLSALRDFEAPAGGVNSIPVITNLSVADRWIIHELEKTVIAVDESMHADRISDAAAAIYHFVWHSFCDWYLEFVKPVIYSTQEASDEGARELRANADERKATQLVMAQMLNRIVRLLHPFVPFITETIYQKLPIRGEACIIDAYPTVKVDRNFYDVGSEEAAFEMTVVKEVVTAVRNIRGENQIKASLPLKVRLAPGDDVVQKILGVNKPAIMRLARLSECEITEAGNTKLCAVVPIRLLQTSIDVVVPLEGVVDIGEEIKRLKKAIEKADKDSTVLQGKLNNENYVKNAPEELVEEDRQLLAQLADRRKRLTEALARLSS